jgi:membrane protease YdiL (CAAX protease family)
VQTHALAVLAIEAACVALLGVAIPLLAMASRRRFDEGRVPRGSRLFVQVIAQLLVIGAFATGVAAATGRLELATPRNLLATTLSGGTFLAVAALTMPWRWRLATPADRARLAQLLPQDRSDAVAWTLACLAAGWAEELAYRGVLTSILAGWTGSLAAGALLSAIAFALAHAVQGPRSALVVFAFALGFQGLCLLSGSLLPAMIVHAAYDLIAGAVYGRLARQGVAVS